LCFRRKIRTPHASRLKEKIFVQPSNDIIPENITKLMLLEQELDSANFRFCMAVYEIPDYETRMVYLHKYIFGYSPEEIAKKFGRNRRWVFRKMNAIPKT
jgi:DNA-directed RNA polymerase specialized sigma24 family protein